MDKELRILILEDSPADAELEEHELRKAGLVFTSKIVDTKEAFLKALKEFLPDLILSDYDLPSFDGLAALRIAQEKCPDVPFILVTGKVGEEFVIDKLKDGATDYVLKNNLKRLVPAVNRALEEAKLINERKRMQEQLRWSQEELSFTLDATTDGIYKWNFKTNVLFFSPRYYTMLGYEPDEFPASFETWKSLLHPDDIAGALCVAENYLSSKPDRYENEFRMKTKTGGYRWIHARSTVVERDEHGATVRIIGNHDDITERKQAEEALRQSEEKYRDLYDNAPDMYHSLDKDGIIIECNETEAKMLGYKKEEIIGRPVTDFFTEESKRLFEPGFTKLKEKEVLLNIEREFIRKDGTTFPAMLNVFAVYNKDGEFIGTKTISRDITIQKQAEKERRKAFEEQELLLDNIQTLIWYLKDSETQGIVNKACADFFGKKKEDLENKKLHDIMSKEEVEICIAGNKEVFEKKVTIQTEEWAKNAKGEKRLVAITKTPKIDENGDVEYVVCSAEDITEHKQAREKTRQKMDEITRINKLFIGREHRFIELKKEVNALLEQLGQPKKYDL